ncbi:MAG: hypothetical protein K9N55_10205 [Phycisphaerae bacterium]|nr:hypothetical protein [Phycisphaerae bacterium]
MNKENHGGSEKWLVLILEDEETVRDACEKTIRKGLEGAGNISVRPAQSKKDARREIDLAAKEGYKLRVVVCDQVNKGDGEKNADRKWGIGFLEEIKDKYRSAFRIMFSGQSEREDIQEMLESGLLHDFTAKRTWKDEKDKIRNIQLLSKKIREMICGRNVGNVKSPCADEEFRAFIKRWMESSPDGENTKVSTLEGDEIALKDVLTDATLTAYFQEILDAARFDRIAKG